MVEAKSCKVYKLYSPEGNDIYIGSTSNSLQKRLIQHRCQAKRGHFITACLLFKKYENVKIQLIENVNNKSDLIDREAYHIRNTKCVNKNIPCKK